MRNASTVYLGATLGCAECHDHKFDPFTTKDFYSFAAFFADVQEQAVALPGPAFAVPTPRSREASWPSSTRQLAAVRTTLDTQTPELDAAQVAWEAQAREQLANPPQLGTWQAIGPFTADSFDAAFDTAYGPESGVDLAATLRRWRARAGRRTRTGPTARCIDLPAERGATYLYRAIESPRATPLVVSLGSDDGLRVWHDGKEVLTERKKRPAQAATKTRSRCNFTRARTICC